MPENYAEFDLNPKTWALHCRSRVCGIPKTATSVEECPIGEGTGVSWVLCALDAVCTTPMLASSVCR